MLSHLISLDTRHQASLTQPAKSVSNPRPLLKMPRTCMHGGGALKLRRDRRAAAENGTSWDEDKS